MTNPKTNEYLNYQIQAILNELNQCREDERTGQNQIIQTIAAAAAILTFICGASFLNLSNENNISSEFLLLSPIDKKRLLFILSELTFGIAIFNIISLGISSVLRFHYIRDLEDKLSVLIKTNKNNPQFINWMSFNSIVNTRNITHITNTGYTILSNIIYDLVVICAICFSFGIIYIQYRNMQNTNILFLLIPTIVAITSAFIFAFISVKSKNMYEKSLEMAIVKRNDRLSQKKDLSQPQSSPKNKNFKKRINTILYFIYPKKKDFQKIILILLGFAIGILLRGGSLNTSSSIKRILVIILVIDVLIYQGRYIWNDIRGLNEDMAASKTDRLPIYDLNIIPSVIISSIVILIRLIISSILIYLFTVKINFSLLICSISIILVSVLYEYYKTKQNTKGIFIFVSLGYPIRLLAGMWGAWTNMWEQCIYINNIKVPVLILIFLLFSYAAYGLFSVTISWTYEAVYQFENGSKIIKKHYIYLLETIKNRYYKYIYKNTDSLYVLQEKGYLFDIWNIAYISSIFLLSVTILTAHFSVLSFILEIITILLSIIICILSYKKIDLAALISFLLIITKFILFAFNSDNVIFYIILCLNQILFLITYYFLRCKFDPSYDFFKVCFNNIKKFFILFVGKETYELMISERQNRTK